MDKVTKMEVDSFMRLIKFYNGFEKYFEEYVLKLQCLTAECLTGDEDAIWEPIRDRLLERLECQAAIVPGILDEIKHERNELQEIVRSAVI